VGTCEIIKYQHAASSRERLIARSAVLASPAGTTGPGAAQPVIDSRKHNRQQAINHRRRGRDE